MGTENKTSARQRKKAEKLADIEQDVVKKETASNGDDNGKQRKQ